MTRRPLAAAGVAAATIAAVVAVGALVTWLRRTPPSLPEKQVSGPFAFCSVQLPDSGELPRSDVEWNYPLVYALLLSLAPEPAKKLERAIAESNRRWERHANPLVEDLEELDPDAPLENWLQHAPSSAATAVAAARPRYCGSDGFCVSVVAGPSPCPAGSEKIASTTPNFRRARFLAWPFAYALWLRAKTPEDALAAARNLRERARSSNYIGLVLSAHDESDVREHASDLRDQLLRHEALRRAAASFRGTEGTASDGYVIERQDPTEAFPAKIGPLDVLVLPRMEGAMSPHLFGTDVRAAAPSMEIAYP